MTEMIETVRHRKKESTFKWFILAFVPIGNLYVLWKLAELLSAHEKAIVQKESVGRD